jgi:hypothetical protein
MIGDYHMNFEWDGVLASRQDRVIDAVFTDGLTMDDDVKALRANKVVGLLAWLVPCNLVVRHWCLLDLIEGKPRHLKKIERQIALLTNNMKSMWLEGYSYWGYTSRILRYYANQFGLLSLQMNIAKMDLWFNHTAYIGLNGIHYPAPFGDVLKDPVENQTTTPGGSMPPVYANSLSTHTLFIRCKAVRFNLHTSTVRMKMYNTHSGIPVPFKFYTGYHDKYPTKRSELWAILKRLFQLSAGFFSW